MSRSLANTYPKKAAFICLFLSAAILLYFFGILEMARAPEKQHSIAHWAMSNWLYHPEYKHGLLIFPSVAIMLFFRKNRILASTLHSCDNASKQYLSILFIALGGLIYLISFRILEPRLTMASLPILIWSGTWFAYGWNTARTIAFPCFFFWIVIPLPSFQHATVGLQYIAISMADFLSSMVGVKTHVQGTNVYAEDGSWGPFSVTGGCSGMRSLVGLFMVACTYAYITNLTSWKFITFVFATIPIAIIGNAFRTSSICIMAHYVSPTFAANTWHDWSGALIFIPISVLCLIVLHRTLEQKSFHQFIKLKRRQIVARNHNN